MSKKKSLQAERSIILSQPHKRPYGVKVHIHLKTAGALGGVDEIGLSLHTGAFLHISPTSKAPWEGGKKYIVKLEGFPTAAAAEVAGKRLVQALLWMAVSTNVPLRLEYSSYEPVSVFERNRGGGISVIAYGDLSTDPTVVLGEIQDAYKLFPEPDDKLLLSMEIFCSAHLESSQRAIFLSLVSALEPLAQAAPLGLDVDSFITNCVKSLKEKQKIDPDVRNSLEGRLLQLKNESIRQALKRLVRETLPSDNKDALQTVDDAYALRSRLIHSGLPKDLDTDLYVEACNISKLMRSIYANMLQRKLACGD